MTEQEKTEIIKSFLQNTERFNGDYEPITTARRIRCDGIIKSTLHGRPAWSNGHIVSLPIDEEVYAQMPEVGASVWHEHYDSFDFCVDAVLSHQPIQPSRYDVDNVWFNNSATVQRAYFDLFWVQFGKSGLRFEQDADDIASTILVFDDSGLVGCIRPMQYSENSQVFPVIEAVIRHQEYGTDEPCEKCGAGEDVWLWAKDRSDGNAGIPICHWCWIDTEGFTEWLVEILENATLEPET